MSSTGLLEETEKSKGNLNRKRKKATNNNTKTQKSDASNDTPIANPKKRIKKYCPNDACYELECEWKECNYMSNSMDEYLAHVDEHLNHYSDQTNQSN